MPDHNHNDMLPVKAPRPQISSLKVENIKNQAHAMIIIWKQNWNVMTMDVDRGIRHVQG